MIKRIFIFSFTLFLFACGASKLASKNVVQKINSDGTFVISGIATDPSYGLTPENAVEVGGAKESQGPLNERRYLNSLAGPNGETLSYYRLGSCCGVISKNGFMGTAILDNYRVTWEGSTDTVSIYINMYDSSILKAPQGFTIRNKK